MKAHGETQWILEPKISSYKFIFSSNRLSCEGFLLLLLKKGGHMVVLDALAGSSCHRFAFISFHFTFHFISFHFISFVSQMIALLDGLARSFCHRLAFISSHLSPIGLLSGMPPLDQFALGLLLLFSVVSRMIVCWCLGSMIFLCELSFVLCACQMFVSEMIAPLDALSGSFSNACVLKTFFPFAS